jgi:mono/diheme cytochrome c family protein
VKRIGERRRGREAGPGNAPSQAAILEFNRRQEMTENPDAKAAAGRILFFLVRCAASALVIGLVVSAVQAQSEDRVKAGLATWRNSGCADCHGAFADGEKQRDEMPAGANLRTTKLGAAALKQTISCGRPGTGMPSFDEGAYKVRACNGLKLGSPPDDLFPAPVTLTPDEIDTVVTYLQTRVIGKGRTVTKEECLFYYADDPDFCEDTK